MKATWSGESYGYDANGNRTQRNNAGCSNYTLNYDLENQLVSVKGMVKATFYYDGDGKRVKATMGGVITTYIGNPSLGSGQDYCEWNGSTATMKNYYYAGSTRMAYARGAGFITCWEII